MKKSIVLTFIFLANFLFSQISNEIKLTEKNILRIFKKTIQQSKKGKFQVGLNPWFTDNTNQKFDKSETIIFQNASSFKRDYCEIINWTFYEKNKFIRNFADYCNEPPMAKVTTKDDYFELKISENNSKLILELYNQNKLKNRFEIISLKSEQSLSYQNEVSYYLTLKKIQ